MTTVRAVLQLAALISLTPKERAECDEVSARINERNEFVRRAKAGEITDAEWIQHQDVVPTAEGIAQMKMRAMPLLCANLRLEISVDEDVGLVVAIRRRPIDRGRSVSTVTIIETEKEHETLDSALEELDARLHAYARARVDELTPIAREG